MGSALISGWLDEGLDPKHLMVMEEIPSRREYIKKEFKVACPDSQKASEKFSPSIVVLAVKPQVMGEVLTLYKEFSDAIFISIAAGITGEFMKKYLGVNAKIIRIMPNLAATVGAGVSVAYSVSVDALDIDRTAKLFGAVGHFIGLPEGEDLLNPVTAISGSGPAYYFLLSEIMVEVAQELGIQKDKANELVKWTMYGSGKLSVESGKSFTQLRE